MATEADGAKTGEAEAGPAVGATQEQQQPEQEQEQQEEVSTMLMQMGWRVTWCI